MCEVFASSCLLLIIIGIDFALYGLESLMNFIDLAFFRCTCNTCAIGDLGMNDENRKDNG